MNLYFPHSFQVTPLSHHGFQGYHSCNQGEDRDSQPLGKMQDEEVDRKVKAPMEAMELALFDTLAELYTHFLFINTHLSAWFLLHKASVEDKTEQLLVRDTGAEQRRLWENWDCVAWAQGVRI